MVAYRSSLLQILSERGYIHQLTNADALDAYAARGPITAYIGFDCTARSLHVGSLVQIMMLRHLQNAGHRPIVLLGGATSRIGDPSGKDAARTMLSEDQIADNMAGIRRNFEPFVHFGDGPSDALLVDNYDWLGGERYLDFLRRIGPHFTINRMLTFDSVRLRLEREQPLSFLEFNYMILQAYDFLELRRRYDCRLQMGGSDQWGNIVNGTELNRRIDSEDCFGLTTPLLTTADGRKMGKTAEGAIWLASDMLSAYDYWQFWRNTHDGDVGRFLRLFTELPLDEIGRLEMLAGSEINDAKIILANEATTMLHGAQAAQAAATTARTTFGEGGAGDDLPAFRIARSELDGNLDLFGLIVKVGLADSKKAARRLVDQGGFRIDGHVIRADDYPRSVASSAPEGLRLSAGKKKHIILQIDD